METVNHIRGRIEHEFREAEGNFARQAAAAAEIQPWNPVGVSLGSERRLTARMDTWMHGLEKPAFDLRPNFLRRASRDRCLSSPRHVATEIWQSSS